VVPGEVETLKRVEEVEKKKTKEREWVSFFLSFFLLTIFFAFEVNAFYMGSAKGGNTSHHISFPAFPLKKINPIPRV
jgi:ATP-dependent Zn protease